MLNRDFGLELKISGGYGQSRDDPIVVLDSNKADASITEMEVLRGIGIGRRIIWRTMVRIPITHMQRSLEKIQIETQQVIKNQIITELENYYFDVNIADADDKPLPTAIAYLDKKLKLELPYEIVYLHYQGMIDYESTSAGFGESFAYDCMGIKATVYVYDKNLSDIDEPAVHRELEISSSELVAENPAASRLRKERLLKYQRLLIRTFMIDGDISILAIGTIRSKFVKLRITFDNDRFLYRIVDHFIEVVEKIIIATKNSIQNLYSEYVQYYRNMATNNRVIPKSISGVDENGKQFVFNMTGFNLDHTERDNFIQVILQEENSISYAYGVLTTVNNEQGDRPSEELAIIAATKEIYIQGLFSVIRLEGGSIILKNICVIDGDDPNKSPILSFLSSPSSLSKLDRLKYIKMWNASRNNVMRQQR